MKDKHSNSFEIRSAEGERGGLPFPLSPVARRGPRLSASSAHGFALVIVLGILVLMVVLIVGFISVAGTERTAAASFHAAASTRQLADTAVSLVQGQINIATTQGSTVAWASQPGMVRTFSNASGGALLNAYKLYSASDMISDSVDLTADLPPATWPDDSAIWTDLNAPVEVNGVKNYPILDPSSLALPVADRPEGFAITSAPGTNLYQTAPMPVRWLYVLQDGRVVAPSNPTGKTATIPGATDANGANPVVGRIAFWTDDDTCKVNINTASEGTYWDTPRANSTGPAATVAAPGDQYEGHLAAYLPAQGEFQRYPGHPATTSLSAVFPNLSKDQIYALVPRVNVGGSNGATTIATTTNSAPISPDSDRLYANVDELIFQPNRTANAPGLTKAQIAQAEFFLTTRSRAPETNLFNLPRIATWPIYKLGASGAPDNAYTTAFDRLIAFCASTGTLGTSTYHPYLFQRENADSGTNDIGLTRNVQLLDYLTYLTGVPVPGFGGNFSTKYGADRDQILTEIFDYIRSVNLQDFTLADPTKMYTDRDPHNYYGSTVPKGSGSVVPSRRGSGPSATMGFGRDYTVSKMILAFICNADGTGFLLNGAKPTLADCGTQKVKDSNDAKIDSNKTSNLVLGGTPLKGEPFFDVGYVVSGAPTGAGNDVFDWNDADGNGICNFEPWEDLNGNGVYDPAEPYIDLNGNSSYDQELHEPLHDWGRDGNFATVDVDGSQGGVANAGKPQGDGAYQPGEKYLQAIVFPELFSPMQGIIMLGADLQMTISGLDSFQINGQAIFPVITGSASFVPAGSVYEHMPFGGGTSYRFFGFQSSSPARGNLPGDTGTHYPFIGTPIKINVPASGETMDFTGGTLTVKLYAGATGTPAPANLMQTLTITFPSATFPIPKLVSTGVPGTSPGSTPTPYGDTPANWWAFSRTGCISPALSATPGVPGYGTAGRLAMIKSLVFTSENGAPKYGVGAFLRPEDDTVRSMVVTHGDHRLVAANQNVEATTFIKHPDYDSGNRMAVNLSGPNASYRAATLTGNDVGGKYISTATYPDDSVPDIHTGATITPEATGDFDNGIGPSVDGAYVNKPDEGDLASTPNISSMVTLPYFQLYRNQNAFNFIGPTYFSPNRQIPSSGMFGSLSTGVKADIPWKTLLFRPQTSHPSYSTTIPDHLMMDLFWMPVVEPYPISDRFSTAGKINMNYQILPFTYIERSTGLRATLKAERLAAIPVKSTSTYDALKYKSVAGYHGNPSFSFRLPIDRDETLTQFETKFYGGQIFKSASEICDIHIVPEGKTVADMSGSFWTTNALTGENLRERIYTTLYPRLTTKSNTFTVHFRVQALKQVPSTTDGTWTEGTDVVLGEYRGSTSIERFIDANNPSIPNYANNPADIPNLDPLDKFYRWRVVENQQFAP